MKIIKIILVAVLLFSVIPLDGFCDDAHSQDTTHQCAMICHSACCYHSILPGQVNYHIPRISAFFVSADENFSQDVVLLTTYRPPIVRS